MVHTQGILHKTDKEQVRRGLAMVRTCSLCSLHQGDSMAQRTACGCLCGSSATLLAAGGVSRGGVEFPPHLSAARREAGLQGLGHSLKCSGY